MNRQDRTVSLLRSDGKEAVFPLPDSMFEASSQLDEISYFPALSMVTAKTVHGDTIQAELPREDTLAPTNGRPIVYLDQKDWSLLANSQHRPDLVLTSEIEAAEKIVDLGSRRAVILPLSSGHLSETLKWSDDAARYKLGLTMAQLSGGWQMRDPLDVRRFELRHAFSRRFDMGELLQPEVFTLEPFVLHGASRRTQKYVAPPDFPKDLRLATEALTSVSTNVDMLLDPHRIEMGSSPGWVAKNQNFTDWLAGEHRTSAQKRQSADVLFLMDVSKETAEEALSSGISENQFSDWLHNHREEDLRAMPALGLFREVMSGLHLNKTRKWSNNDLVDLMYLTCAAAYADYVVAERLMASQIAQAQRRLGRKVNVYRRLSDLLEEMEGLPVDDSKPAAP